MSGFRRASRNDSEDLTEVKLNLDVVMLKREVTSAPVTPRKNSLDGRPRKSSRDYMLRRNQERWKEKWDAVLYQEWEMALYFRNMGPEMLEPVD